MKFHFFKLLFLVLIFPFILGCGDGANIPKTHSFSGKASYKGKPVKGAMVVFTPKETGRPSYGTLDDNGNFEMTYSARAKGVTPGVNRVSLLPNTPGPTDPPLDKETKELFEKYSETNSGMNITISKDEKDYVLEFN